MKITVSLRKGQDGQPETKVFERATQYSWRVDGKRFSVNLPNRKKFTTTSDNVIYMVKQEDSDDS